ncbi:helix-turn-helix domain-containing protein [Metabacillus halosaccharovorans]|uniref:helix-turn-helix domain-containing protein n=1 Tax=Metabacillus halosaccharovorans TaxID=930124 RepID=UPI00204258D5|nr:helix-turn-helix domain-containing protein [Metabacillus halosaccharovorans]MCM3442158.1 helix-turn-helix domain-containing protein [Metabacillus halosaccharovorans]
MVGERVRELRQGKGYTISELAELAGVSKSYLSYIERDLQKNPSIQFLKKIAIPLGTEVEDLLGASPSYDPLNTNIIDKEWNILLNKAIKEGMSKNDFREFRDYLRFKKWINSKQRNPTIITQEDLSDD